jgi:hypothetical protein
MKYFIMMLKLEREMKEDQVVKKMNFGLHGHCHWDGLYKAFGLKDKMDQTLMQLIDHINLIQMVIIW